MPQPIPKITTKNSTKNSTSSSSSEKHFLEIDFELNICELKKTTRPKFMNIVENNDSDMVLAVIEECATTNVKSYRGFEAAFNSYLERKCRSREDVVKAATKFRENKKKNYNNRNKANSSDNTNANGFNNFKAREYDYNKLEKKLLGWDKE